MYLIPIMSHLLQMRGLKQAFESGKDLNTVSHLLQMRGLKRKLDLQLFFKRLVASFTDAWIETGLFGSIGANKRVASFTDAWIETQKNGT